MEVNVNSDLLSVICTVPISFENFRCTIESRDELPPPEVVLRIKIIEESDKRKNDTRVTVSGAMLAKRQSAKQKYNKNSGGNKSGNESKSESKTGTFKYKFHRCRKVGHKAADCTGNVKRADNANKVDDLCLYVANETLNTRVTEHRNKWYLDSGCMAHMCKNGAEFVEIVDKNLGKLNLASNASTEIKARGTVSISTEVSDQQKM